MCGVCVSSYVTLYDMATVTRQGSGSTHRTANTPNGQLAEREVFLPMK